MAVVDDVHAAAAPREAFQLCVDELRRNRVTVELHDKVGQRIATLVRAEAAMVTSGAASALTFLNLNGVHFPMDDGSVYNALIDIANKRLDKPGLALVLRKLVEKSK